MERDFMGIGGKGLLRGEDGHGRGSCTSSVHRPLPSKASCFQQFIPFKPSANPDEKQKLTIPDHARMSGFQPTIGFNPHNKMIPQKNFSMGWQNTQPIPLHRHPMQGTNGYDPNLHLSSDPRMPPLSLGGSYFKVSSPASGSGQPLPSPRQHKPNPGFAPPIFGGAANGAFLPRDKSSQLPATAQLTIFYGGYVNAYDNVPLDKAQAIMFMAANSSTAATRSVPTVKTKAPFQAPTKAIAPVHPKLSLTPPKPSTASPRSGFSSPISVISHSAVHSTSSSSSPDERKAHNATPDARSEPAKMPANEGPLTSSTSTVAKPVPMMRKLSLARFLEKRKERCTNMSPYPPPNEKQFESGEPSSSSAGTAANSTEKEWRWKSASTSKGSTDGNGKPMDTKLEICGAPLPFWMKPF